MRVPNSEAWIDKHAVVAVARMADSYLNDRKPTDKDLPKGFVPVALVNFSIRLSDGKAINFQHQDRKTVSDFLSAIGVTWEG